MPDNKNKAKSLSQYDQQTADTAGKYQRQSRKTKYLSARDAEKVESAEGKFVDWYSDPSTRERFVGTEKELDEGIQRALDTHIQSGFTAPGVHAEYDSGATRGYREDGTFGYLDKDDPAYYPAKITLGRADEEIVGHELTHASDFDDQLGLQLKEVLGEFKGKGKFARYLNKPGELYGNFHEVRQKLGLKPWERSFTPEKLEQLIEFKGLGKDETLKRYIDEFGTEKFSEALNKVANVEADQKRLDRLNLSFDDNVMIRTNSTYT